MGHDFGASVAWNAAIMRPNRFTAVFGMSVPFLPPGGTSFLQQLREAGKDDFYMFRQMRAEADSEWVDAATTIPGMLYWTSGSAPENQRWDPFDPARGLIRPPRSAFPAGLMQSTWRRQLPIFSARDFMGRSTTTGRSNLSPTWLARSLARRSVIRSARTAATWSRGEPSTISSSTSACSARNARRSWRGVPLAIEETTPTHNLPSLPAPLSAAVSSRLCTSLRISRPQDRMRTPANVGCAPQLCRWNKLTPIASSSVRTWRLTSDGRTPSASAALRKLP